MEGVKIEGNDLEQSCRSDQDETFKTSINFLTLSRKLKNGFSQTLAIEE